MEKERKHMIITHWGYFHILSEGKNYKVKKIVINPGHKISLQYHNKRDEHWVIVEGEAKVTIADENLRMFPEKQEYFNIKKGVHHRIENISKDKLLIFIETQTGEYCGEDDIIMIDDDYNRV